MNKASLMKKCLSLAKRAEGKTSPNPMVGALLIKDGEIIANDYHRKPGTPHAEALVLKQAGDRAKGASLFVTLEPCCHTNKRTPPCTNAIIASQIKDVFIAMLDPNPMVSGRGVDILKASGINVEIGILEDEAKKLNEAYIKYITTKRPFVTLKIAMTLDGKIADPEGHSKWITCEESRKVVHRLRSASDGLLSAIGTVLADNPSFTARIRGGIDPIRIIIDPDLKTPDGFNVLKTPPPTIIVCKDGNPRSSILINNGIEILTYKDKLDLNWLMEELGKRQIMSILIEGGSTLAGHALEESIVDKVMFFIAPKIIRGKDSLTAIGGETFQKINEAHQLKEYKIKKIGSDFLIEGYLS
ncbi:MAG: bifunctional diaminohydroxyphosphoribosylaminopyrimidine deaminase/5-amino-6-(5-phosphoribosylamino)uracil reductase RibD [Nitrospirae bacterium]|nr:bifunctional diaminohydroxyphosphoribosylaminopyrimidine deaminase/5-amino-6-(5-phosphoribosylamino)uracil reductase RibD [Nitrospirota bacterium]